MPASWQQHRCTVPVDAANASSRMSHVASWQMQEHLHHSPRSKLLKLHNSTKQNSEPAVQSGGCRSQLAVHLPRWRTKNQATQRIPAQTSLPSCQCCNRKHPSTPLTSHKIEACCWLCQGICPKHDQARTGACIVQDINFRMYMLYSQHYLATLMF